MTIGQLQEQIVAKIAELYNKTEDDYSQAINALMYVLELTKEGE